MAKSKKILYIFTLSIFILLVICTVSSKFISDAIMPVVEVMKPVGMDLNDNAHDKVISNGAIITGAYDKKYVYITRQRKGLFGQEYYAVLLEVSIIDSNDLYAALEGWNVTVFDDVVVSSSKDLTAGEVVKLSNKKSRGD